MVIGELRDTRGMATAMANIPVSNNSGSSPFYRQFQTTGTSRFPEKSKYLSPSTSITHIWGKQKQILLIPLLSFSHPITVCWPCLFLCMNRFPALLGKTPFLYLYLNSFYHNETQIAAVHGTVTQTTRCYHFLFSLIREELIEKSKSSL